jgi:hypothetical protein
MTLQVEASAGLQLSPATVKWAQAGRTLHCKNVYYPLICHQLLYTMSSPVAGAVARALGSTLKTCADAVQQGMWYMGRGDPRTRRGKVSACIHLRREHLGGSATTRPRHAAA